ncbi:MAG TPA: FAD-binding oxidoreductase [Pirellulales bacterium]|nr:FAD-binding oxidoreductase [Pirellulales bacterium]
MIAYREQILTGWGNVAGERARIYRPERLGDLRDAVETCGETLISRGLGRGYGDAAINAGVVSHLRLNRMLAFDDQRGIVECEAGVTFDDLLRVGLPRGFFPAVTPGTKHVTIGGAIAADVHGKNHHADGSLADCLLDFRLLTASGETLRCSRTENAAAFWATLGGMGLTGAIVDARLRMRPVTSAFLTVDYEKTADLDATLERFAQGDARYQYSVAWIDCLARGPSLGRSVLMRGNHTPVEELPADIGPHLASPSGREYGPHLTSPRGRGKLRMPCFLPNLVLNSWSVRAFNALYYRRHGDRRAVVDYDTFFYPLDAVADWNRIYGRRGFLQYQAVFPTATSRTGLVALLEALAASRQASFLAVLKTFGPANQGLLSFPVAGSTLAVDLPNTGPAVMGLLDDLDEIVIRHGGRVYLAKDVRLSRRAFEAMYPQADEFRRIKAAIDPQGRFDSALARRLGLSGEIGQQRAAA